MATMHFLRLKEGLSKTRESLFGKVRHLLAGKTMDESVLENLEETLLGADVGVATATEIVRRIRERVKVQNTNEVDALLRDEIRKMFANGSQEGEMRVNDDKPYVIMIVGVNGVGKTTTVGKLAHLYKSSGKRVLVAAADTFRAAANEQLSIWAKRAGVEIIQGGLTTGVTDPAAVAYDALTAAVAREADIVLVDTAGRLHTKSNLMEELKKIKRALQKLIPSAPHEVLLVLDASIGQNAIQQARLFNEAVGVTGLVVTKLDGTAKGGVVLAISRELRIPVRFVGVGEEIDDLQPFDRQMFVEALLA